MHMPAQVLMATHLKRTESVVQPALFRFDEHFELQDLIGASRNSEVLYWPAHGCVASCFRPSAPVMSMLKCHASLQHPYGQP